MTKRPKRPSTQSKPRAPSSPEWEELTAARDLPAALERHLAFLCETPACEALLPRLCAKADRAEILGNELVITFVVDHRQWRLRAAGPFQGTFADDVPASHRMLCQRHNGISLELDDDLPLQFFGVDRQGALTGGGFEATYLRAADPGSYQAMVQTKVPIIDPIGLHQDFVLYNFLTKTAAKEPTLSLLSHEGGGLTAYDRTLGLAGIFLRLVAAEVLGCPQPSARGTNSAGTGRILDGSAEVIAHIAPESLWEDACPAKSISLGAWFVVVGFGRADVYSVSSAGCTLARRIDTGIRTPNSLQDAGGDQLFIADREGYAVVDVQRGTMTAKYSSDWGRHSSLLRGKEILVDRYLRARSPEGLKSSPADAETKLLQRAAESHSTGLILQPLGGSAVEANVLGKDLGARAWVDLGEGVLAATARGFAIAKTGADLAAVEEFRLVRCDALTGARRSGELIVGWNSGCTRAADNLLVLADAGSDRPRLVQGLFPGTRVLDVVTRGDLLYVLAGLEGQSLLITAEQQGGGLAATRSSALEDFEGQSLALLGELLVVTGSDGGGRVLRL